MGRIVEVYIDDLIVKSKTCTEHMQHLEKAFALIWKYNMKLNPLNVHLVLKWASFLPFWYLNEESK